MSSSSIYLRHTHTFYVPRSFDSLQVNFVRVRFEQWSSVSINILSEKKGKCLKKVWIEKQRRLKNFSLFIYAHAHTHIYTRYAYLHFVLKYPCMRPWSKHNTRSIDYVLVSIFCRYGNEIRSLFWCPSENGDDDDDDASTSRITGGKDVLLLRMCVAERVSVPGR